MNFNEQKGNLFDLDLDIYSLAHCISLDCEMGAGIALEFNNLFPDLKPYLKQTVKKYLYDAPSVIDYQYNNIYIFNLITKQFYYNKPTYKSMENCLNILRSKCLIYGIKHLAIPRLGCGLDKLNWNKVRMMIMEKFKDEDIDIQVRYL